MVNSTLSTGSGKNGTRSRQEMDDSTVLIGVASSDP